MASNVKGVIKAVQKTAEVVQKLRHPSNKGKVLVIVEGADDKNLFDGLFNASYSTVHPVGSCAYIKPIATALNVVYRKRLVFIRDSDFMRAEGLSSAIENVFWTDYHDAEIMQLEGEGAYHLCDTYCPGSFPKDVFDQTILPLEPISRLKWYNVTANLGYPLSDFKVVNYSNRCLPLIVDFGKYFADVTASHSRVSITMPDHVQFNVNHATADLRQISNGHDTVSLLLAMVHGEYKKNLSKKSFTKKMRQLYTPNIFRTTQLYASLSSWIASMGIVNFL